MAIQATAEETADSEDTAGGIMQPDNPNLHLIVQFEYNRYRTVLQQRFSPFKTLLHHLPDIALLLDCEPNHDVDHFGDDELRQS